MTHYHASRRDGAASIALLLLALGAVTLGQPVENQYLPAAGGLWSVAENWSLGHSPAPNEWAVVPVGPDSDKVVTFDPIDPVFAARLILRGDGVSPYSVQFIQQQGTLNLSDNEYLGVYGHTEHRLEGLGRLTVATLFVGCQDPEFPDFGGSGEFYLNTDRNESAGIVADMCVLGMSIGMNTTGVFDHRNGFFTTRVFLSGNGRYLMRPLDPTSRLRVTDWFDIGGNDGEFLHESGIVETNDLRVAGTTYRLSEDTGPAHLVISGDFEISYPPATFEQIAGTVDAPNLTMLGGGTDPVIPSEYRLAGGTARSQLINKYANSQLKLEGGRLVTASIVNSGGAIVHTDGVADIGTLTNQDPAIVTLGGSAVCRAATIVNNSSLNLSGNALLCEPEGGDPAVGCLVTNDRFGTFRMDGGAFRGLLQTDGEFDFTGGDFSEGRIAGGIRGHTRIDGPMTCQSLYSMATVWITERGSFLAANPAAGSFPINLDGSLVLAPGAHVSVLPGQVHAEYLVVQGGEGTPPVIHGMVSGDTLSMYPTPGELLVYGDIGYLFLELTAAGASPGEYDRITAEGRVTATVLRLRAAEGYEPQIGDVLSPISWTVPSAILNFELPSLPAGMMWDIRPGDTGLELEVVALEPCPGDVDYDYDVDLNDLATLLSHFGMTEGATLGDGDLNGDGSVDLSDLSLLLNEFGKSCG